MDNICSAYSHGHNVVFQELIIITLHTKHEDASKSLHTVPGT